MVGRSLDGDKSRLDKAEQAWRVISSDAIQNFDFQLLRRTGVKDFKGAAHLKRRRINGVRCDRSQ